MEALRSSHFSQLPIFELSSSQLPDTFPNNFARPYVSNDAEVIQDCQQKKGRSNHDRSSIRLNIFRLKPEATRDHDDTR